MAALGLRTQACSKGCVAVLPSGGHLGNGDLIQKTIAINAAFKASCKSFIYMRGNNC